MLVFVYIATHMFDPILKSAVDSFLDAVWMIRITVEVLLFGMKSKQLTGNGAESTCLLLKTPSVNLE